MKYIWHQKLSRTFQQASFCLLAIFLVFAASCNKDDGTSPKYHDTLRCKVNGVEWKAVDNKGGLFGMGPQGAVDLQYYHDTNFFEIAAGREINSPMTDQSITFFTREIKLNNRSNTISFRTQAFTDWLNPSGCRFYDLDTSSTRLLIITELDTVNYILKGTFEFSAINNCADTVHVTDGYFDATYRF